MARNDDHRSFIPVLIPKLYWIVVVVVLCLATYCAELKGPFRFSFAVPDDDYEGGFWHREADEMDERDGERRSEGV